MGKSYYIANPDVVFREEEDGGILMDPETGELKFLNETGAFIFRLCDGGHTEEDIVEIVTREFEVDNREKVKEDVKVFLKELKEKNLVGLSLKEGVVS